jgi:hypothetical protein
MPPMDFNTAITLVLAALAVLLTALALFHGCPVKVKL